MAEAMQSTSDCRPDAALRDRKASATWSGGGGWSPFCHRRRWLVSCTGNFIDATAVGASGCSCSSRMSRNAWPPWGPPEGAAGGMAQ